MIGYIDNICYYFPLMTDAHFFMGYVTRGSRLGVLLMFCLFFSQFQPSVAYKRVAYKKKRVYDPSSYMVHFL